MRFKSVSESSVDKWFSDLRTMTSKTSLVYVFLKVYGSSQVV